MTEQTIPESWKTDHLILLVGSNPLPNYVAAQLLLNEGGTLHLLHSVQTREIADLIKAHMEYRQKKSTKSSMICCPFFQDLSMRR